MALSSAHGGSEPYQGARATKALTRMDAHRARARAIVWVVSQLRVATGSERPLDPLPLSEKVA